MGDHPRFWGFLIKDGIATWEWSSFVTREEFRARKDARGRGEAVPKFQYDVYGYPGFPMREPVLREFWDASGSLSAFITRNGYGCEILNTSNVLFIDVDAAPPPEPAAPESKKRRKPPTAVVSSTEDRVLTQALKWTQERPNWGLRVYRTHSGWRLLATHALFNPIDPATDAVMEAFDSDLRYRRLCRIQNCFRARLTPKAWRCGYTKPPTRSSWCVDDELRGRYASWLTVYQKIAGDYATCRLLAVFGDNPEPHPDVSPIIAVHDGMAGVGSGLLLA